MKRLLSFVALALILMLAFTSTGLASAEHTSIEVVDQAGRTVSLDAPAERIVSGYYISTSACIALGLSDRVVGIEAKADTRPMYRMAAPALIDLPNVGTAKEFNLEGCVALEPDLVILPKRLKDSAETLQSLGIPTLLVNPESQAELMGMLQIIGQATGTQARAEELTRYYDQQFAAIADLPATRMAPPTVYMGGNSAYLSTAPKGMYQAALIEAARCVNAGQDIEGTSWVEVSYEQMLAMNPYALIIPSEASYTEDDIKGDGQMQLLDAVKEGRIYQMPRDFEAWDSPTLSSVLGVRYIMSRLGTATYSIDDLRADAAEFYQTVYGCDIDASLIG